MYIFPVTVYKFFNYILRKLANPKDNLIFLFEGMG